MQTGSDAVTHNPLRLHAARPRTMCHLLLQRANETPDRIAYSFLAAADEMSHLTDRDLLARSVRLARTLQANTQRGDRVILAFPPGLEFIVAFYGCLLAGVVAIPATYPKRRGRAETRSGSPSRLTKIISDSDASLGLTTSNAISFMSDEPSDSFRWICVDEGDSDAGHNGAPAARPFEEFGEPSAEDVAFLQYTSGSTAEPKGVVVTHANIVNNLEVIATGFQGDSKLADDEHRVGVFWLPAYHDMGLIGAILMPFYAEWRSVLMPPTLFLQQPALWLETIGKLRAGLTGAPNFALDRCVEKISPEQRTKIDLSSLKLLFCGAEPIRSSTIERFSRAFHDCGLGDDVWYPCYGMAETTLMASGGYGPGELQTIALNQAALVENRVEPVDPSHHSSPAVQVVSCGQAHCGHRIVIVEPSTLQPLPEQQIGEIWIAGGSIAQGYWKQPEATAETFEATLPDRSENWLRTGDLGFLFEGNLFVTGRAKDVIIIRGQNFYPQDIEYTVGQSHSALLPDACAAFSVDRGDEEAIVVVQELDRHHRSDDKDELFQQIRASISDRFEVDLEAIVLIRQASLPRTTSGKVQRNLCRQQYLQGGLAIVDQWQRPTPSDRSSAALNSDELARDDQALLKQQIETWLVNWLQSRCGETEGHITADTPFAETGLDSVAAVELSFEIEQWLQIQLSTAMTWDHPTPASLAESLAELVVNEPPLDGK